MKEVKPYLEHIPQECIFLLKHSDEITFHEFIENPVLTRAFIRSLEVIGEAVKNLPQDFKEKHANIPWKEIAGMRNKLIHEYFGVNYKIVWETVKRDIPELEKKIKEILESNLKG